MTPVTTPAWLQRIRVYSVMYRQHIESGMEPGVAARAVDLAMVTDTLERRLKRVPSYDEVQAELAKL